MVVLLTANPVAVRRSSERICRWIIFLCTKMSPVCSGMDIWSVHQQQQKRLYSHYFNTIIIHKKISTQKSNTELLIMVRSVQGRDSYLCEFYVKFKQRRAVVRTTDVRYTIVVRCKYLNYSQVIAISYCRCPVLNSLNSHQFLRIKNTLRQQLRYPSSQEILNRPTSPLPYLLLDKLSAYLVG